MGDTSHDNITLCSIVRSENFSVLYELLNCRECPKKIRCKISRWVRLTYSRLHMHQVQSQVTIRARPRKIPSIIPFGGRNIQYPERICQAMPPLSLRRSDRVFSAAHERIIFARSPPIPCRRWPLSSLLATEQSQRTKRLHASASARDCYADAGGRRSKLGRGVHARPAASPSDPLRRPAAGGDRVPRAAPAAANRQPGAAARVSQGLLWSS